MASTDTAPPGARTFPRPTLVEWGVLIAGLFLTLRYAWFLDDAFVYFRYADNALYLGHGLVYNAGEWVEGYSSPLWMLLVLVLRATGLNYWLLTRAVGLLAFAVFWAGLVLLNARMSAPGASRVNLPLCYLGVNYGVLTYFTSGIETPLVQVAAVAFALFILRPESRVLQVVLAGSPLLRPELALPLLVCIALAGWRTRKVPWFMVAGTALLNGTWLLFRVWTYADLLPNTFYLKDAFSPGQGFVYLWDTVGTYHTWVFLGLAAVLFFLARAPSSGAGDRRDRTPAEQQDAIGALVPVGAAPRAVMLVLALSITLYVIKIGGDPRHFRYLAFPFCLAVCATGGLVEGVLARRTRYRAALAAAAGVVIAALSFSLYPAQLGTHPARGTGTYRMVNKINDAAYHRYHPTLAISPWASGAAFEQKHLYASSGPASSTGDPYLRVNASAWCVTHYREFDARVVHSLGLTDAVLSRCRVDTLRPGHKRALIPLARDLARIYRENGAPPGRGMFRRAVDEGRAAPWIGASLELIEVVEKKIFNRHRPLENLGLALRPVPPIIPGAEATRRRGPANVEAPLHDGEDR